MLDSNEITIEIKEKGWPVVFKVCQEHKDEFFADYKQAVVSDEKHCVLCHECDNDSLGG